jgi:hypothetical protein
VHDVKTNTCANLGILNFPRVIFMPKTLTVKDSKKAADISFEEFTTEFLPLADIIVDFKYQVRDHLDEEAIEDYAEKVRLGVVFPPVDVFRDSNGTLLLANGFHRIEAHRRAHKRKIEANVRSGGGREVKLFGATANAANGIRMTHADKRRAVTMLLSDPYWAKWSDQELARLLKGLVTQPFVSKVRRELSASGAIETPQKRLASRGGKTYEVTPPKRPKANKEQEIPIPVTEEAPAPLPLLSYLTEDLEEKNPEIYETLTIGDFFTLGKSCCLLFDFLSAMADLSPYADDFPRVSLSVVDTAFDDLPSWEWLINFSDTVVVVCPNPSNLWNLAEETKRSPESAHFTFAEGQVYWIGIFAKKLKVKAAIPSFFESIQHLYLTLYSIYSEPGDRLLYLNPQSTICSLAEKNDRLVIVATVDEIKARNELKEYDALGQGKLTRAD